MKPITDLQKLIREMTPVLTEEVWHYCSVKEVQLNPELLTAAFAMVRERESITLILPTKESYLLGQKSESGYRRIELQVYSSLEAVGLTAAISKCLTEHNISANVIAGYHHDHIFVPEKDAQAAINALHILTQSNTHI